MYLKVLSDLCAACCMKAASFSAFLTFLTSAVNSSGGVDI